MYLNKILAEFFGTYIFLLVIICTGNAWAIGLILALAIIFLGKTSGGNFNPAVTVMMVLGKKQPISDLAPYIIAQLFAGFVALQTCNLLKSHKLL
jgi:aquaporin Z